MRIENVNNGRDDAQFKTDVVEKKYNAKFVGQFCLKTKDGSWANAPADVYWQAKPPVEGYSCYFALIYQGGSVYITDGSSAVEPIISAVVADDGEILYSRYRHDYRVSKDKSVFIDGGRDYTRSSVTKHIYLKIIDGNFYKVEDIEQ